MKKLLSLLFTLLLFNVQIKGQISLVKDINAIPTGSMPDYYTRLTFFESVNDKVVFITQDNNNKRTITSFDTTNRSVKSLKSFNGSTQERFKFTKFNGFLYFLDYGSTGAGVELWKTDGTVEGTLKVKDGMAWSFSEIIVYQGFMYFISNNSIWKSDGTSNGTNVIYTTSDIYMSKRTYEKNQNLFVFNNHIIFRKHNQNYGYDLCKLNLSNLNYSSIVGMLYYRGDLPRISSTVDCDTSMYFTERRNDLVYLWKIKQNTFRTTMIDSLLEAQTQDLTKVNNSVMFLTDTKLYSIRNSRGDKLTVLKDTLSNIPYPYGYYNEGISFSTVSNNKFYFISSGRNSGYKLWKSDGTVNGTTTIKSLSNKPTAIFEMDNSLYFKIYQENKLWKSDGTTANTNITVDFQNVQTDSLNNFDKQFYPLNHKAYFWGNTPQIGAEPYSTDGNTSLSLLADIGKGTKSAYPYLTQSVKINGILYFLADDGVGGFGYTLWKSDGTPNGTSLVKRISSNWYSNINNLVSMNGILYFTAADDTHGVELWRSDGTSVGTYMVKDVFPNPFYGSSPTNLTAFRGYLYFTARDGINTNGDLWRTDGTEAGTTKFKQATFGATFSNLFVSNNKLFFISGGYVLWVTDGTITGTNTIRNLDPNTIGLRLFNPTCFAQMRNKVYFLSGYSPDNNPSTPSREGLFESDGTNNGTKIVRDFGLYQGIVDSLGLSSNSPFLTSINNQLFFRVNTIRPGTTYSQDCYLWTSDGTATGTKFMGLQTKSLLGYYSVASTNTDTYYLFNKDYDGREAELWKFNNNGTDIKIKTFPSYNRYNSQWVSFENKLYLVYTPVDNDSTEIFEINGENIELLYKSGQRISQVVEMDGNFYFKSYTPAYGSELWKAAFCYYVTSKQSGNWDDPNTWDCNNVPTQNNTVLIKPNHVIDVNSGEKKVKKLILRGNVNIQSKISFQE